jgi:hypothetical protein
MHHRFASSVISALVIGCRWLTEPPLPSGAERYTPPPVYQRWWAMTEACSDIVLPFDGVQFYRVPGAWSVPYGAYGEVAGYWSSTSNRIVLAGDHLGDARIVRHEMLHALLRKRGHPPEYFQGRCAGVVDCGTVGCQHGGPVPVRAPAGAPTLALSSLDLRVDLLPNPVTRSGADSVLSLVVRVTNPHAGPVWVPLEPTPSVPGSPAYAGFFGFDLCPLGSDASLVGMQQSILMQPVPFAPGETRQFIFDVSVTRYPVGDYVATGLYNTRHVSVTLHVAP